MQLTTRRDVELQLERAAAALPAGTAASSNDAASRELLGEVWIIPGGYRADKRNLPAEQGKGVNGVKTRECNYRPEEGTKGGHAYTVKYE